MNIIACLILSCLVPCYTVGSDDLDNLSTTLQLIKRAGYPAESHLVTTDDGYILTIHRIPGKSGSIPVFLQHGLACSSSTWMWVGRDRSLAYKLADAGYDVWMGNVRGNTYSKAHMHLSTANSKFWEFSMHEMGVYDLPAEISYVRNFTSQRVIYVGYSMGGTIGLILGSDRSDIAEKMIRLMIFLAPAAYFKHVKGPIQLLTPFTNQILFLARLIGRHEVPLKVEWMRAASSYFCGLNIIDMKLCAYFIHYTLGVNLEILNLTRMPLFFGHFPDSTSIYALAQYGQWFNTDHFRQLDYGFNKNIRKYNSTGPPDYDVSRFNIPIAIYYGDGDFYATSEDVHKLYSLLQNPVGLFKVNYTDFQHMDFALAMNSPTLIYDEMIELMKNYD